MSDDATGGSRSVAVVDELLLDAKLTPPRQRSKGVSRTDLIDLARSSDCRVVGVTAPAGYGKSTLLAQWAHREDRPVAWVSLDRFDDDAATLITLLASAYARISPADAGLVADVGGLGVSPLGRGAPRLAAAFRSSPNPFVLMLDDLHELRSPACHDVLGVAIAGVPLGSQIVAASRADQPHLPRLRATGDAHELGAHDLALDATGTELIFYGANVALTPDLAAAVTERTEGWPAGIYLAALIAQQGDAPLGVTGDDRFVADYLYREALSKLPEPTQQFLRRTSVLDQLSAPLCDAVLGSERSHEQLRDLEVSNMFLVPLDRTREWYRYHGLFREFLHSELRRTEPHLEPKLHLHAADWYEANGSPSMAFEHLINTTEQDRCVQLLTQLVLPTYSAGQLSTLERWLSAIDDANIAAYPPLAVLAGWVAVLTGHTADAQRWADVTDRASFDQVPLDGSASFESARAMLRAMMCRDGPEQMLADASFAVSQEPAWSPWRDSALCLSAMARQLVGDLEGASVEFVEASRVGTEVGNPDTITYSDGRLAMMAMDEGRWADARDRTEHALAAVGEYRVHDYATSVLVFVAAARLAVHRGDMEEANRQLVQAMRTRPTCTFALPSIAVDVRLQLAKVHWSIGDPTTARHLLREIDDILRERSALGTLVEQVSEFRLVLDDVHTGPTGASPLSPAELRLLPYLQTHLTFREIAERLYVSRNTISSEVGSIYRKLGVSSRSEAVERATVIGLIGG